VSGLRSWPGFCWCRLSARRRSGPEEADDGVEFGGIVHGIRLGRRWRGPACPGNNEPGRTARAARRWPCAGWEWQRPFITLCISCKTCRVMTSGKRDRAAFPPSCRIFGGCPSGGFPRRGRGLVALREKENPELHQLGAGSGWERMGVRLIVRPAGARPS
jgi:hypothetical protein